MDKFIPSLDWDWNDNYDDATAAQITPHGVYRARIIRDDYPEQPENDGGCPIVRIDTNRGYSFNPEMTGYGAGYDDGLGRTAAEILTYFHERTRDAIEMFARYLRIFHDGNLVERGPDNYSDYYYVAYVTRTLWENWGNVSAPICDAEMDEYRYWLEGDVYGIAVDRATSFDEDGEPDDWTEIEDTDVWGFYGETYAKEAAEEALADEIADVATRMLPVSL